MKVVNGDTENQKNSKNFIFKAFFSRFGLFAKKIAFTTDSWEELERLHEAAKSHPHELGFSYIASITVTGVWRGGV